MKCYFVLHKPSDNEDHRVTVSTSLRGVAVLGEILLLCDNIVEFGCFSRLDKHSGFWTTLWTRDIVVHDGRVQTSLLQSDYDLEHVCSILLSSRNAHLRLRDLEMYLTKIRIQLEHERRAKCDD